MMRKLLIGFAILAIICGIIAAYAYKVIWGKNVFDPHSKQFIYVPSDSSFDALTKIINDQEILEHPKHFEWTAQLMKFGDGNVKPGKYAIPDESSNRDFIQLLRSGNQSPIDVTVGSHRMYLPLLGTVSQYFEFDSVALVQYVHNNLNKFERTEEDVITLFTQDTYRMYWNTSTESFMKRMVKETKDFWNTNQRQIKASELGLTDIEVVTLASIVEKESNHAPERPTIAGVYINRLKRGIPLQADPTVVFGIGDFTMRRVLNKHLAHPSPYNTYLNSGLPPGPICIPSKNAIDAVLNYDKHNYLYFCAKPGYEGKHSFAKTLVAHNVNARKYQRWLSKEGIKK